MTSRAVARHLRSRAVDWPEAVALKSASHALPAVSYAGSGTGKKSPEGGVGTWAGGVATVMVGVVARAARIGFSCGRSQGLSRRSNWVCMRSTSLC